MHKKLITPYAPRTGRLLRRERHTGVCRNPVEVLRENPIDRIEKTSGTDHHRRIIKAPHFYMLIRRSSHAISQNHLLRLPPSSKINMTASKKLIKQRATGNNSQTPITNISYTLRQQISPRMQGIGFHPVLTRQPGKAPYKDFSNILPPLGYVAPTRIVDMNFAEKVHHMLSDPECAHFIAWMPHGRAFKVYVSEKENYQKEIC